MMSKFAENPELISSRTNERVKQLAALLADGAARRESGRCAAPGLKLCEEAAKAGLLEELWYTGRAMERQGERIETLLAEADRLGHTVRAVEMTEPVADKLSDQKTPQGIVGAARLPQMANADGAGAADWLRGRRRVLALCGVQDPGNLGTVLRTAAALGYDVAFGPGCADPFSPKALRASMGAAFRTETALFTNETEFAAAARTAGLRTVATALTPGAVPITEIDRGGALALFIGNEGNGLAAETVAACGCAAIIPITDRVESLNAAAAAAIAMWELRP